jgi:single-stranded DNA-binding protein
MRKFETKDGVKVTKHEVVAENVRFLSKRPDQGADRDTKEPGEDIGRYEPEEPL